MEDKTKTEESASMEKRELNSMCVDCKCLNIDCFGTTDKKWTECVWKK